MSIAEFEIIDVECEITNNQVVFDCPYCRLKGLSRKRNNNSPIVQHRHGIHSKNTLTTPHCININLPSNIIKGSYGFRLNCAENNH